MVVFRSLSAFVLLYFSCEMLAADTDKEGGMEIKAQGLKNLDTDGLLELRDRIDEILSQRRQQLEGQLQRIDGRRLGSGDDAQSNGQSKFRVLPKYRSKIDPNATWSGRGMLPKWMQEEMKGTTLSKEDFRIAHYTNPQ
jgi:DNA-binding protein H-NS